MWGPPSMGPGPSIPYQMASEQTPCLDIHAEALFATDFGTDVG